MKIYVVTGSSDGTLGIYRSMAKALKRGREYVKDSVNFPIKTDIESGPYRASISSPDAEATAEVIYEILI